jgi:hypothetical protein
MAKAQISSTELKGGYEEAPNHRKSQIFLSDKQQKPKLVRMNPPKWFRSASKQHRKGKGKVQDTPIRDYLPRVRLEGPSNSNIHFVAS